MKSPRFALAVLLALATWVVAASAAEQANILIDSLDSVKGWSVAGRGRVEADARGYLRGCLKAQFGGPGEENFSIVQGPSPSAAEAWAKRGKAEPNAFSFWARVEAPVRLSLNLRVRKRGVPGPSGVVGITVAYATVKGDGWKRYEIPFAAFEWINAIGLDVGSPLFTTYHPQIQFSVDKSSLKGGARTVWIDEIAFTSMPSEALAAYSRTGKGQPTMEWTGLELARQLTLECERFKTASAPVWRAVVAPGMKSPAPAAARTQCDLLQGWTFLPVETPKGRPANLGKPQTTDVPHRFPGNRDYAAAWYALRIQLSPKPGERLVIEFDQVPLFCALFVNGIECGRHLGAFTPFEFDITNAVKDGDNLMVLYVHDMSAALDDGRAYNQVSGVRPQSIRTMSGGIGGGVRLERRPSAHVADVFVKTSVRKREMNLLCEVASTATMAQPAQLSFAVVEWPTGTPVDLGIPSQDIKLEPGKTQKVTVRVPWDSPRLWSAEHPNLYVLRTTLTASSGKSDRSDRSDPSDSLDTRFGFREFWIEGRQFVLNGIPTRLRGESHYRYGRETQSADPVTGVDFNREIIRLIESLFDVNSCRVHAYIAPGSVALGADEAGFLLINQSSIWSAMGSHYRQGGERFLENTRREFAEWVRRDRNSPSVVIWDVENEMIRGGRENMPWVMKLDGFVLEHDDTRPIEHSGAGWYDDKQQIIHLHMQEHYTEILDMWREKGKQPVVIGEFWVGGRGETRLPSSLEFTSRKEWYDEEARLYEEYLMEMRYYGIAGVMPFRISGSVFVMDGSEKLEFMPNAPKGTPPAYGIRSQLALERIRHGLQPLTVFFWPRVESAIAGEKLERRIIVCNDSETMREGLTVEWAWEGQSARSARVTLAAGEQLPLTVEIEPAAKDAVLTCRLLEDGKVVSKDALLIRAVAPERLATPQLKRRLIVYEGAKPGATEALRKIGFPPTVSDTVPDNPKETLWVIAPKASDRALNGQRQAIREYLDRGGRILCLPQEQWPRWSPVRLEFWPAVRAVPTEFADFGWPEDSKGLYYSRHAPIYASGHPAFEGIAANDLRWWSDHDGRVSDDALVRPSAVGVRSPGAWRILAGGCRYENASLAEARVGAGLLVFCQAQVLEQSKCPEARAVLMNLLRYLDSENWTTGKARIRLAGGLSAAGIKALTGAQADSFEGASPEKGDLSIAGDGAPVEELARWAEAGGRVLVLSAEVAGRLPGYAIERDKGFVYAGSRAQDHPLLWGVSAASFTGFDHPCVEGALSATPKTAKVLLHGLKAKEKDAQMTGNDIGHRGITTLDAAPPIAVSEARGKGEWIVTTMAPWRGRTAQDAELLSTLLTNAGVAIPAPDRQPKAVKVLKTVPIRIDGRLDDWTNDVEDRNVSPYRHAQPIVLCCEDAVEGTVASDGELSAIVYFLWDEKALYAAGAVFCGGGNPAVTMRIGGRSLEVSLSGGGRPPERLTASPLQRRSWRAGAPDRRNSRTRARFPLQRSIGASAI